MIDGALEKTILIGIWYFILFIVVPAICLHSFVKEKRLVFRLAFYQIAGLSNLMFWGYLFAFFHIWPVWALRILMIYLPILLKVILDRKRIFAPIISNLKELREKTITKNMLIRRFWIWFKQKVNICFERYLKHSFAQIILLLILAVFIVWYYGYFKLHYTTFASSDESTHLYWIHALMTGQAFPVGLYPHMLHFLVASLSSLLGISALYVNHYLSILSILLIHFALFSVLKMLLSSKSAAIFGVGFFTIADLFLTGFRYQMTLPMELGFIPMLMLIIFLREYVKERDRVSWWMLILSLFCATQAHFASVAFALIFVVAFLIVFPRSMFRLKTLAALGLALVISIAPFGVGLVAGYQMEQSMGWAISLLENRDDYYEGNELADHTEEETTVQEETTTQPETVQEEQQASKPKFQLKEFSYYVTNAVHMLMEDVASSLVVAILLFALEFFALFYALFKLIIAKKKKQKSDAFLIPVIWLITYLVYVVPKIMGSTLAGSQRLQILLSLVSCLLFAVPIQAVSDLLKKIRGSEKWSENVLLSLTAVGLCIFFFVGDIKKLDTMFYDFVIQSESFKLTDDLINNNERNTWTVISPVNDLVGIRCYGYHYEIIDLLWEIENGEEEFYIPTPDIYVVAEKRVPHFFPGDTTIFLKTNRDGKDLTEDRSDPLDESYVNKDFDEVGIYEYNKKSSSYYEFRLPVMSKLNAWVEKLKQTYPGEVSVYSEDENCIVYHITQNPYFLLNLALPYRTDES